MIDVDLIEIDGKDYVVVGEKNDGDTTYVYLCNNEDENDLMIRKVDSTGELLLPLADEEEVQKALKLFALSEE